MEDSEVTMRFYLKIWTISNTCQDHRVAVSCDQSCLTNKVNGKMHGNGQYTWLDGSTYEGAFSQGERLELGVCVCVNPVTRCRRSLLIYTAICEGCNHMIQPLFVPCFSWWPLTCGWLVQFMVCGD